MSQFIDSMSDEDAQHLTGGKGKNILFKPLKKIDQSLSSPIRSSAVSTSNAIAINISIFSVNSPQTAIATAVSSANSIVDGSTLVA